MLLAKYKVPEVGRQLSDARATTAAAVDDAPLLGAMFAACLPLRNHLPASVMCLMGLDGIICLIKSQTHGQFFQFLLKQMDGHSYSGGRTLGIQSILYGPPPLSTQQCYSTKAAISTTLN